MKILITGGAGYVGSILTAHLLRSGFEVSVFDKFIYGGESLLGHLGAPTFSFTSGDVRDPVALRQAMRSVDAVVHLAAIVGEPACSIDEQSAYDINYLGTKNVVTLAREYGLDRLLLISTSSIYGTTIPNSVTDESSPLVPLSLYAKSKVAAERLALDDDSLTCAVLRFGTVCGVSPRMRFDLLVAELARAAVLGQSIQIFAPEAWRPFLHIRDSARVIEHLLSCPSQRLELKVFNVVSENYQKKRLVELALKHYPQATVTITERQPDLRDYKVTSNRIQECTQFQPMYSVEDAFVETAHAIEAGVFRNCLWRGHSAIPDAKAKLFFHQDFSSSLFEQICAGSRL